MNINEMKGNNKVSLPVDPSHQQSIASVLTSSLEYFDLISMCISEPSLRKPTMSEYFDYLSFSPSCEPPS